MFLAVAFGVQVVVLPLSPLTRRHTAVSPTELGRREKPQRQAEARSQALHLGLHTLAGVRETRHSPGGWGLRKSQDAEQSEGAPGTGTSGLRQRPRSCLIQEALGGQGAVLLVLNEESGLDRFSGFFQLQFHEVKFGEESPAPGMPPQGNNEAASLLPTSGPGQWGEGRRL